MTAAEFGKLNLEQLPSPRLTRTVDSFQKLEQIGEGTYGQVYMAKEVKTGQIVALKKIRTENEKEGFPISAIREIKILSKLHHENVIKLKEVVTSQEFTAAQESSNDAAVGNSKNSDSVYLVFEYMDHDLTGLSDRPGLRFTVPQIKCYMKQLLTGLHYCHTNEVLHRDIKGATLLLDNNGSLKLADFGLAHSCSDHHKTSLTNRVITLPYRPPELLLGATEYGPAVDIWSVGCIFAELLCGKPIMFGRNEPEQLHKLFELCGSPDEISWPGVSKMPWYNNFKPARPMRRRLREVFLHRLDPHALDLLDRMLTLDPSKRISTKDALGAEYFRTEPLPCDPKSLPKYESSHEFQTKKKRQQQRLNEEMAKRHKLPYPPPHVRLPPIKQVGPVLYEPWTETNHSMSRLPRMPCAGPSNAITDTGIPNRYPPRAYNQNNGVQYHSHGRAGPYAANRSTTIPTYAAGPPGYSHSTQYGIGSSHGPNSVASNRNQQYGWQQ